MLKFDLLAGTQDSSGERNFLSFSKKKTEEELRSSYFDLASLTKVLSTSVLMADEYLKSNLSEEAFFQKKMLEKIPELRGSFLEDIELGRVWEHTSGLIDYEALFTEEELKKRGSREDSWVHVIQKILGSEKLFKENRGVCYSDLGFLLLGVYLERSSKNTLDKVFEEWKKAHSLEDCSVHYKFQLPEKAQIIPTDKKADLTQVNDLNARGLNSVSSHAGLFGTIEGILDLLEGVHEWSQREQKIQQFINLDLRKTSLHRFHWGWDTPTGGVLSQAGASAPSDVIGHLGYTGTALWWSPRRKQYAVLLTNRVYPDDSKESRELIKKIRRSYFSAFWQGKLIKSCQELLS